IRDFHVTGVQTCALPICKEKKDKTGGLQRGFVQGSPKAAIPQNWESLYEVTEKVKVNQLALHDDPEIQTEKQVSKQIFQIHNRFIISQIKSGLDRKSTRLNSSHVKISYAVFCLKKKIKNTIIPAN